LVTPSPAQADKRQDGEEENLQQVCYVWRGSMHRLAKIRAQQKHEQQRERRLRSQEELPFEPLDLSAYRALVGMSAWGDGKGDEEYEGTKSGKIVLQLLG